MAELFLRTMTADQITPVRAYASVRMRNRETSSFLLESVVAGERWGRYSIVGYRPIKECIVPKGTNAMVSALESALPEEGAEEIAARFVRAAVGFVGYGAANADNKIRPWADEAYLARVILRPTVIVFDNLKQTLTIAGETQEAVDRAHFEMMNGEEMFSVLGPDPNAEPEGVRASMTDAAYAEKVLRAKEYIAAGDVFQVVLSRRFSGSLNGAEPLDIYRALRVLSPSPYLYFFEFAVTPFHPTTYQVIGASPETLVRVENGVMTLRPIAGTRPRGKTEAEDRALAAELLADPKERAEHVMLIDLARNDAGRVCEPGSVELVQQMEVERYSHVMHIVSEVRGKVREGVKLPEVAQAAFPAGTLTGAPKVRAMQIIRELEPHARGIYGGAIGYATENALDMAIGIRTVVCTQGLFEVTAGAGIVADSVPEAEAEETKNKAKAALAAVRAAQDTHVRREGILKRRAEAKAKREAAKAAAPAEGAGDDS